MSLLLEQRLETTQTEDKFAKRNALIRKGESVCAIAQAVSVKHGAIQNYMHNHFATDEQGNFITDEQGNKRKWYDVWKEARDQRKPRVRNKQIQSKIFGYIMDFFQNVHACNIALAQDIAVSKLPEEERWAAAQALRYIRGREAHSENEHSFDVLFSVLRRYSEACRQNTPLSLKEMGADYGLQARSVGKILDKLDLDRFHKQKEREITPSHIKEAMKRSVHVPMPLADIAHLLGVPAYKLKANLAIWNLAQPNIAPYLVRLGSTHSKRVVTYQNSSQIYEAVDVGFDHDQTSELLDLDRAVVDYALTHRKIIEPVIIGALRTLYASKEISKPYVQS